MSFLWLHKNLDISIGIAKRQNAFRFYPFGPIRCFWNRILYETFQKHISDCDALFCIVGILQTDERTVVQLVKYEQLAGKKIPTLIEMGVVRVFEAVPKRP